MTTTVFQQELSDLKKQVRKEFPAPLLETYDGFVAVQEKEKVASRAVTIGDRVADFRLPMVKKSGEKASNFTLSDAFGNTVSLSTLLGKGPVVINFYRGNWCPFCNLELKALERSLKDFTVLGAQLIAISPEAPDKGILTTESNKLTFPVLHDAQNMVARKFGIVHELPSYLTTVFERFGLDLSKHNGTDKVELPLPATYIIDRDFTIRFAFATEDYTKRADVKDIVDTLKKIKPLSSVSTLLKKGSF